MRANTLLKISWGLPACLLACLVLAGCGGGELNPSAVLESRPIRMDGEQVILEQGQVQCGAHEDLWIVSQLGEGRAVARLTQKGRDLQFSDDVQIGDPSIGVPYVQLRGALRIKVMQMGSIREEDAFTKLGDAKIGVRIDHICFQNNPPILMGIRHGQFDQSAAPVFRFKLDGEWLVDQIVH